MSNAESQNIAIVDPNSLRFRTFRELVLVMLFVFLSVSCHHPDEPPVHRETTPPFALTFVEAGPSYATFRLHIVDTAGSRSYIVSHDSVRSGRIITVPRSFSQDTVITDSTLFRGRTYHFKAFRVRIDTFGVIIPIDSTKELIIRTLDKASISLTVLDTGVTDSYLHLSMPDRNSIRNVEVVRVQGTDGEKKIMFHGFLAGNDTVLYDHLLIPHESYEYRVYRADNKFNYVDSNSVPSIIQTLDTTAGDYMWTDEILGAETSELKDVSIAGESDIWVVGELYANDSLGHIDHDPYFAAEFKEHHWKFHRFSYYDPIFKATLPIGEIDGVWAFNSEDVWFASGPVFHWDGKEITTYLLADSVIGFKEYVTKLWASSPSNIWGVGPNGIVVHYDGSRWLRIPTTHKVDLTDVWGTPNGSTVWMCGSIREDSTIVYAFSNGYLELKYFGERADAVPFSETSLSGFARSVWAPNSNRVYTLTDLSLYQSDIDRMAHRKGTALTSKNVFGAWPGFAVRGNGANDIFCVGGKYINHFNGVSWITNEGFQNPYDNFSRVAVHGSIIVAVGERFYNGIQRYGLVSWGRR